MLQKTNNPLSFMDGFIIQIVPVIGLLIIQRGLIAWLLQIGLG